MAKPRSSWMSDEILLRAKLVAQSDNAFATKAVSLQKVWPSANAIFPLSDNASLKESSLRGSAMMRLKWLSIPSTLPSIFANLTVAALASEKST